MTTKNSSSNTPSKYSYSYGTSWTAGDRSIWPMFTLADMSSFSGMVWGQRCLMTMMITSVQWRVFPATEMILSGQDDSSSGSSSSDSDSDSGQDDKDIDIDERNEGDDEGKGEAEFEGDLGDVEMGDELPDDDIDIDIFLPGRRARR